VGKQARFQILRQLPVGTDIGAALDLLSVQGHPKLLQGVIHLAIAEGWISTLRPNSQLPMSNTNQRTFQRLDCELPDGDPYEVPGVPRDIVKTWIVASLGSGKAATSWPRKRLADATPPEQKRLQSFDVSAVKAGVCAKYPFMEAPARAVAVPAGLTRLTHLGTPERLLSLRLQAIEARALTVAMMLLSRTYGETHGALALPVHDSLIVPLTAVREALMIIKGSFAYNANVEVRMIVDPKPSQAEVIIEQGAKVT
jgi:hypothetical protein